MSDVEAFANQWGLQEHTALLKKGALVAQDPANYENLDLSEDEKNALRIEVTRKWKHTTTLYVTIIVCSIGAAVQGWDQTGSNGANLSWPDDFGLPQGPGPQCNAPGVNCATNEWIVGIVNSMPYFCIFLVYVSLYPSLLNMRSPVQF